MKNKVCQQISIAHSKIGEVMICPECGVVHLSLQSISLRLELSAFAELSKMLAQAQTTIEQAQNFMLEKKTQESKNIFH